jgi:hypothetical protein
MRFGRGKRPLVPAILTSGPKGNIHGDTHVCGRCRAGLPGDFSCVHRDLRYGANLVRWDLHRWTDHLQQQLWSRAHHVQRHLRRQPFHLQHGLRDDEKRLHRGLQWRLRLRRDVRGYVHRLWSWLHQQLHGMQNDLLKRVHRVRRQLCRHERRLRYDLQQHKHLMQYDLQRRQHSLHGRYRLRRLRSILAVLRAKTL